MSTFTTRPSITWPGYTDIFEDGVLSASTPEAKADDMISYLRTSHDRHFQDIADRLAAHDPRLVLVSGHAYSIGLESGRNVPSHCKGFGGDRWLIRFHDGRRVECDSLWHLGDIPSEWRAQLPENATLEALR